MNYINELRIAGGDDCVDILPADGSVVIKAISIVHTDDVVFVSIKETPISGGAEVAVQTTKGRAGAIPGPLVPRRDRYFSEVEISAGAVRAYNFPG